MHLDLDRTIVAVSSPLVPAARAIVRISGRLTRSLLAAVHAMHCAEGQGRGHQIGFDCQGTGPEIERWLASNEPTYFLADFDLNWCNRRIKVGVYYWPTQRSFTGEPCAELHLIGSPPIVQRVLDRLHQLGAYPADRGEFALRSFLAGKLDLVQAEAVLGVIQSVHGQQLQWALSQLGGNLSRAVQGLRNEIVELLARLEAGLDFVDEDIEFITSAELLQRTAKISGQIAALAEQLEARGGANRKLELVLVGLPNAGKSSLFNALLGQERSITTAQAGTTRDAVAAALDIPGVRVTLVDTAGMEELEEDTPRSAAQGVLKQRIETADILLLCVDASDPPRPEWLRDQRCQLAADHRVVWVIGTKADQLQEVSKDFSLDQIVSIHWPDSIQSLRSGLQRLIESHQHSKFTEATYHTAVRCRDALHRAGSGLERAMGLLQSDEGEELVASELHGVLDDLASIIGQVHNDDILGEIFSRFCIGK